MGRLMMVYQHHRALRRHRLSGGLYRREIHPWAKICAIADVFDAMSSDRSYQAGKPISEVAEYLPTGWIGIRQGYGAMLEHDDRKLSCSRADRLVSVPGRVARRFAEQLRKARRDAVQRERSPPLPARLLPQPAESGRFGIPDHLSLARSGAGLAQCVCHQCIARWHRFPAQRGALSARIVAAIASQWATCDDRNCQLPPRRAAML